MGFSSLGGIMIEDTGDGSQEPVVLSNRLEVAQLVLAQGEQAFCMSGFQNGLSLAK